MTYRRFQLSFLAFAVGAALAGCSGEDARTLKSATSEPEAVSVAPLAQTLKLEKDELKIGFIKLTDMAPLAIAYEKGFFEEEGTETI